MLPVLADKDMVIGSRFAYFFDEPKCGDIIIFVHDGIRGRLIKRVAAVEGDVVSVKDGAAYVNGEPCGGAYEGDLPDMPETAVPEGAFFVLGDNSAYSKDSRVWEEPFVYKSDIKARAVFRYFPSFEKLR